MDPSRPADHPSAFRRRTASLSELHAPHDHHDQPSLPPIRSLHPFLNPPPPQPSSSHPPHGGSGEGSSAYGFSDAPHSSSMHAHGMPAPASLSHQRDHDYSMADSDAEDDQQGPPKKKRRRQALSCTECKRRKIKCDRVHPCTPCSRRGEQDRCHWNIIEPTEKYVSRQEHDELKARVEHLEGLVQRLLSGTTAAAPYYQMGVPGAPDNPSAYPGGGGMYPQQPHAGMMPPPPPLNLPYDVPHPSSGERDRERERARVSPSAATRSPPVATAAKHSLASITSPYNAAGPGPADPVPKNCHAQTLKLGERLRHLPCALTREDPASAVTSLLSTLTGPASSASACHRPRAAMASSAMQASAY
ncbi:uncharacterized protein SCHCODRAFT_02598013 [Schizophyllum commune H4-8]|uniref:Zn(2)-C6 fungal-type domain-containing protein n=1 Tax=Schizophyllum commune (strain H4-8 / FGSC 9210) TaxID=578458 RepID=D8Q2M7_SCHCM|nr:uncharacterized protein SCHCODRAFT_02598013 [Schizophyllum commune H4-8]KAI5894519.1 hypothetical protein SCHCODRAFT_02598013 [Schizophyllum commune H4-8]